jgi:hypothetical protein
VWKEDKASRLVVTVLLNRFVPGVVFHQKEGGTMDVVDGKQRLTTLLSFVMASQNPKLYRELIQEKIGMDFKQLSKLDETYDCLDGLTFDHLSSERKVAFEEFCIACTIIPKDTCKDDIFSIYEDINSGGEDLTAQQLRRAVYYGDYITLLDELVQTNKDFQAIRDPKSFHKGTYQVCPKDSDRELVLRAFAWRRNYSRYKRPLKTFLNAELQYYDDISGEKAKLEHLDTNKAEFIWAMKIARNTFDDKAFRTLRGDGSDWTTAITPALWDVLYLVLCELRSEGIADTAFLENKEAIQTCLGNILNNDGNESSVDMSGAVNTKKFLQRKHLLLSSFREILQQEGPYPQPTTPRTFSNKEELKNVLWLKQEGLCSICGQSIDASRLSDGAYVHLDHIIPYAKGGQSTSDNCGLAHQACNQKKGAKLL